MRMVSLRATSAPFRSSAGCGSYMIVLPRSRPRPRATHPSFCKRQGFWVIVIEGTYGVTLVACGANHG